MEGEERDGCQNRHITHGTTRVSATMLRIQDGKAYSTFVGCQIAQQLPGDAYLLGVRSASVTLLFLAVLENLMWSGELVCLEVA